MSWAAFFFSHWLFHPLIGRGYQFYSGVAGLFIDASLVTGIGAYWKRHNCHVSRCWRLQWKHTAAGDCVCRKHHPDSPKSAHRVHQDHHEALRRPDGQ